ncbi:MAG: WD40 repeat domain-containing protein, partial [Chloroflexota bacterium]
CMLSFDVINLKSYDGQMPHGFAFRDDTTMLTFSELPYFGTQIRQWSLDDDAPMSMPFTGNGTEPIIANATSMSPNGRYMYYEQIQYTVGYQVNSRKWIYDFETDNAYEVDNFYGNWDAQFLDDETLFGVSGSQAYLYDVAGRIADDEENSEDVTIFTIPHEYMTNIWWSVADTIVVASSGFVGNNAVTMVTLPCVAPQVSQSTENDCLGKVTLWDARTGQTLYQLRDDSWNSAVSVNLSGDGETLLVGTCEPDESVRWFSCHDVYVYDLSTIEYDANSEEVPVIDVEAIAQLTDLPHEVYDITVQPNGEGQELIAVSGATLTTFVTLDERNRIEQYATLPMSEVTFSLDGDLAFVTDRQGRIEIWGVPPANRSTVDAEEADSSLRLMTRPEITGDTIGMTETIANYENGPAFRFALSPDERTLAIGTSSGIYLHDAYDLNVEPQFIGQPRDRTGYYLDYSDNGDLFVISVDRFTDEMLAHVYRAETGQFDLLYEASIPDMTYIVQGVDISPDGQTLMLATCMNESDIYIENSQSFCIGGGLAQIELIDFADTSQVEVITLQATSNAVVAMREDWSYMAYFSDGDIYLRDMVNPSEVRPVIEMPVFDVDNFYMGSDLFNLYFTPDGSEIGVVLASNGQFESWTVDELTSVDVSSPDAFRVDGSPVPDVGAFNIVFHPQTQDRLIARSDSITVRNASGERLTEFRSVNHPRDMIVSGNGERVYVLNDTGVIQVFHWDSRLVMNMITDYTLTSSMMLESSRDGRLWVSYTSGGTDGISSIWEITDDGITRQNLLPEDDITNPVKRATISPDNRYIAYVEGTYISVYDRQQDEHRRLDVVLGVVDITFADNGELVAIVSERGAGVRKVYDAEMLVTGDVPYPYLGEPIEEMGALNSTPRITDEFMSFTMSSNGEMMAVHQCNGGMPDAYWYGCIRAEEAVVVLDGASTEPVATLDFFDDTIRFNQMALTHDGAYLAISYCEDSSPDDWDCEANMSEVALYSVEALRAGDLTPFAVIDNVDAWSTNKGLRLHRQSDGTFLVMVSRWEEVSDDLLEIITYVWSVTDDGTSSLVYDDNVSRLLFAPTGQYVVETDDDYLAFRAVPLR